MESIVIFASRYDNAITRNISRSISLICLWTTETRIMPDIRRNIDKLHAPRRNIKFAGNLTLYQKQHIGRYRVNSDE